MPEAPSLKAHSESRAPHESDKATTTGRSGGVKTSCFMYVTCTLVCDVRTKASPLHPGLPLVTTSLAPTRVGRPHTKEWTCSWGLAPRSDSSAARPGIGHRENEWMLVPLWPGGAASAVDRIGARGVVGGRVVVAHAGLALVLAVATTSAARGPGTGRDSSAGARARGDCRRGRGSLSRCLTLGGIPAVSLSGVARCQRWQGHLRRRWGFVLGGTTRAPAAPQLNRDLVQLALAELGGHPLLPSGLS